MKLKPYSVAIVVSDRKKAVKWYTTKLGLSVIDRMEHWVTVGNKGRGIRLHLCQTSELQKRAKLEPGNSGIAFTVDTDMMSAYRTLKRRGVKFDNLPKKMEWGWFCSFVDPDGNVFWLMPDA